MHRKAQQLTAAILLLIALLVSTSAVGAQVPNDQSAQGGPPQGFQIAGAKISKPDEKNPSSAALRSATALRASLTAQQRKSIQAILQEYELSLTRATKQLAAPSQLSEPSRDVAAIKARATADATSLQALQQSSLRVQAIQSKIDAKINIILTAEQRTLYQAALAPAMVELEQAKMAAQRASVTPSYNTNYNITYCNYASQYASYADYYSYYARLYAYYNYIYNTYGSYSAYYYLNLADGATTNGQHRTNSAYFDEYTLHADPFGRASSGRSYESSATTYAYYGYSYALSNYNTYHYTYAYYAYYYGYLTNQRAYYAYVYVYYC